MNKFLTFPGVQPIYLGDVDFLQESVRESFVQLLRGLTGQEKPRCILQRATSEADGIICLDGEIMPYKAYTGGMIGNYDYKVVSTYDGSRVFKNGETHACYEYRYAQEVLGTFGTTAPTFDELLLGRVKAKQVAENDSDGTIRRITRYTTLGNSVAIENTFEFLSEATVEYLCESTPMSIVDSGVLSQFPKYCSFIAESNGALVCVPAKVTFVADSTNLTLVKMTVKINQTKFAAGTKGMLSFTVVK